MSEVFPYLYIKGAAQAIDFYARAFGARESYARITDGDGRVGHAEITIGSSTLMLADEHPEIGVVSPATLGGSHMSFFVAVPDVDDVVKRATTEGAKLLKPVQDQFYGDRSGFIQDPFGHLWGIATHIEDVSPKDMQERMKKMMQAA